MSPESVPTYISDSRAPNAMLVSGYSPSRCFTTALLRVSHTWTPCKKQKSERRLRRPKGALPIEICHLRRKQTSSNSMEIRPRHLRCPCEPCTCVDVRHVEGPTRPSCGLCQPSRFDPHLLAISSPVSAFLLKDATYFDNFLEHSISLHTFILKLQKNSPKGCY